MNRAIKDRFRGLGPVVAAIFIIIALSGGRDALAGHIVISSLPDTLRQENHSADAIDTITFSGTKISSAANGLMMLFTYQDPLDGWFIDLGTDTLEFGTGGGSNLYGITLRNQSGYPANNIVINGGYIIHNPPRNDDSTIKNNTCFTFSGNNIKLRNVNMIANGWNGKCILGGQGYGIEIDGGSYNSRVDYYDSRCLFDAIIMNYTGVVFDSAYAAANGFTYNISIHGIRINAAPHAGIRIASTAGSPTDNAVAKIYDNQINVDAHNFKYTSYSGTCYSSSNPYGIALQRVGPGTEIYNNTITAGTTYGGSRGILIETARGNSSRYVEVFNNNIDIHEGPNAEYDENHIETHAVRLRNDCQYLHFHHNTVVGSGDANTETPSYGRSIAALRYTFEGAYGGVNSHNLIENNHFLARSLTSGVTAYSVCFDAVTLPDTTLVFRYNRIESDNILMKYGEVNAGAKGITIFGDTLSFISPTYSPKTFVIGHFCNNWDCRDNFVCDAVYQNGASDQDITFTCTSNGSLELGLERMFKINVVGSNGLPVAGATIAVTNNYGFIVINSTTDRLGQLVRPALYHWESNGTDSTAFNTFSIKARKNSDSTVINYTAAATTTPPTITLSHTTGEEATDSIPPSSIHDLGAATGVNPGDIFLTWTATGDDSTSGQASAYEIRYSLNNINFVNWNSATLYNSVPAPLASGTSQSLTISGLQPGTVYYLGIKAADAVGNISNLSNIVSCQSQVDLSLGNDETEVALFYPSTGDILNTSHPTLTVTNVNNIDTNRYYFQVAADSSFVSPVAASPPIPQQTGSRTSWKVDGRLTSGVNYYWRAKVNQNNFSPAAVFSIHPETHAFPNPFKPVRGQVATFTDIPDNSDLLIMTVTGGTVRHWTKITSGEVIWDGTNEAGLPVGSGTYLWYIEGSGNSGKLLLIR
ncbi:hypothetical protein TRIP_C21183 [Candidatus Zixiibacteriota bacterium]|nr:hypothetical protein TRIP_C21183 [candidate division Zixibacteria bacterium]